MKLKLLNSKKLLSPFISLFLSSNNQRMQDDSSIDWSTDTPVTASLLPCIPLVGVHMPLPCVLLPQIGTSSNIRLEPSSPDPILLNYSNS